MVEDKKLYMAQPFRVSHSDGSVVAGFDDMESAQTDADQRNKRASDLKLSCRYTATAK